MTREVYSSMTTREVCAQVVYKLVGQRTKLLTLDHKTINH